jgi:hypothetical protein
MMRIQTRSFVVMFTTAISLLAMTSASDARARGPEKHGNMKTIVIPNNGTPVTTIAPNDRGATIARATKRRPGSRPPAISNPARAQVPVGSIIAPAVKKGGPTIIPGLQ